MKKIVVLLFLALIALMALTFVNIPKVSATTTEDLHVAPGLPEEVPREPMPENYTPEEYLNTTNQYSDLVSPQGGIEEVDDPEGANPLYVLVFGDEEEREVIRHVGPEGQYPVYWNTWAKLQMERGDETLVANFGIDIRILGFQEWDSADGLDSMYDLWYELESDTAQYLGQWYNGEWWSNYVDAIVGITSQNTPGDPRPIAGLTSGSEYLDQGRTFTLLKWQVYWLDDNLAQHEVSHLFYAPDHDQTCCAMAGHTHFQWYIWEDGMWWVLNDVPCAYTSYHWCNDCQDCINAHNQWPAGYQLSISSEPGGTTNPPAGYYIYRLGTAVTVTASAYLHYTFDYWVLDGATVYDNPLTVSMTSDHILKAYFSFVNFPPETPSTPSGPTSGYKGSTYTYSTSTTDSDGDDVLYQFDWGDGSYTTTGLYASGASVSRSHSWSSTGTYYVKVRAQDSYGLWSNWSSSLTVTIDSSDGGGGGGGGRYYLCPY